MEGNLRGNNDTLRLKSGLILHTEFETDSDVVGGSGIFDEVLPGDYRVVVLGNANYFHAVQVKAGQQVMVSLP